MDLVPINTKKVISICETQPLTVHGLRHLLDSSEDLEFGSLHASPAEWMLSSTAHKTDVLIIDKGLGAKTVLDALSQLPAEHGTARATVPAVVVWGMSITEAEALRFLQAGAKGIIRKSADTDTVLACLRSVAQGRSWMQDSVFRDSPPTAEAHTRTDLTPREHQVMELVEQGFKNREIAQELGIRPGTVKIHLKHIFEKTGVRGRHGLALNGLRQKGVISLLAS
ncbi:MAG: response regulator transcription factor [Acidobacteriaceae bacterium]|nr:response regulator transcription factor [Acidobacteriaceae bacterium]MBV9503245.1 response regulator transcription factor [Acidobacteriaceae bacterium]